MYFDLQAARGTLAYVTTVEYRKEIILKGLGMKDDQFMLVLTSTYS